MKREFTTQEMQWLSQFETNMQTAVRSHWASPLTDTALRDMAHLFNEVTGGNRRASTSCAACILELLTDMGHLYFAQKEATGGAEKKQVATRPAKPAKVTGVAVKTSKTSK